MRTIAVLRLGVLAVFVAICGFLTYSMWTSLNVRGPHSRKGYAQYKDTSWHDSPNASWHNPLPDMLPSIPDIPPKIQEIPKPTRSDEVTHEPINEISKPTQSDNTIGDVSTVKSVQDPSFVVEPNVGIGVHSQIQPGLTLVFRGVFEEGVVMLELLESSIEPELQRKYHIVSGQSPIHLHIRLGSKGAVANSAGSGAKWGNEVPMKDPLQGKNKELMEFKITLMEKHFELVCNGEKLTEFPYRFNPFRIGEFRFQCAGTTNCVRDASVQFLPAKLSVECFGNYCKEPARSSLTSPLNVAVGINHSVYINLEHRKDRRAAIEDVLTKASIPFERLDAVNPHTDPDSKNMLSGCFDTERCPGQVGCQMSHLKALKKAIDLGLDHIAVFEDDFAFQPWVDLSMVQTAIAGAMLLVPDWEVIALSLNINSETQLDGYSVKFSATNAVGITRINAAQTTGAYIARKSIIPHIYNEWLPENCHVKKDYFTAIDQCWKPLQTDRKWIAFEPQPGTQIRSFSDIEKREVDYGLKRR